MSVAVTHDPDPPIRSSQLIVASERISTIFFLVLCKAVLDYSYTEFISPVFSYAGFTYDPNPLRIAVSYVIVVSLGAVVPLGARRPSSAFVYLYLLMIVMPIVSLWALRGEDSIFLFLVIGSYMTILAVLRTPLVLFRMNVRHGERILHLFFWLLLAYLVLIIWQRNGVSFLTLDPTKIYDARTEASEQVFFGFAGYAKEWFGKVVNPALMVLALARRKFSVLVALIVIQGLLGGFTTAKEYLIYPVLVIATYYIVSKGWSFQRSITQLIIVALIFALAIGIYTDFLIIPAVIIQRPFFIIANLHYEYYYFFDQNPHVYMSNTALSFLAEYPYRDAVPNIIGRGLWGKDNSSFANAGFLATAFMHFGILGMFVFSIIVGILMKVFDLLVIGRMPLEVGISVGIVPAMQLVNGDLTASLLSHGIGLCFLVLLLIGKREWAYTE